MGRLPLLKEQLFSTILNEADESRPQRCFFQLDEVIPSALPDKAEHIKIKYLFFVLKSS